MTTLELGDVPLLRCGGQATFKHMLLKRAYTEAQMTSLVCDSAFKSCEIIKSLVGMEVRLVRQQPLAEQAV